MTVAICPVRPSSAARSWPKRRWPGAAGDPPGYLSDSDDLRVLRAGYEHSRRIFEAPAWPAIARSKSPLAPI